MNTFVTSIGLTMYLFILLFSTQVLRGVLEEKSNKINELIITVVKPTKFLIGKIIGISLVGITQLVLISILVIIIFSMGHNVINIENSELLKNKFNIALSQENLNNVFNYITSSIDYVYIVIFILYFLGGYFLYAIIFAIIGAVVNHNDDLTFLSTIVSLPLLISIFLISNIANSPDNNLYTWLSIIPFTSPIIMISRMVYSIKLGHIIISILSLYITVILFMIVGGKIYHDNILTNGRRISLKIFIKSLSNLLR